MAGATPERAEPTQSDGTCAPSRALVALTPGPSRPARAHPRRNAAFLAHLLAIRDRQPQTCERRRAAPHEAIAAYRGAAALSR